MTPRHNVSHEPQAQLQSELNRSYRLFYDATAKRLLGVCHFGEMAEGPPGMVHGGAASAMLDTAMGNLCWWSGQKVVTGRLSVDYRSMLPLNTTCSVSAWFDREEGRKVL